MSHKLYFYEHEKDLTNFIKYKKLDIGKHKIVTNDTQTYSLLDKAGIKSERIEDIFLPISEKSFLFHKEVVKQILEYKKHLRVLHFSDIPIFNLLEPKLIDEIDFILKTQIIIENSKNCIFIFQNYSFSYNVIKNLHGTEFQILQIINGNTHNINLKSNKPDINFKNKFNYLTSTGYSTALKLGLSIISKSVFPNSINKILEKIDTHLKMNTRNNNAKVGFFITPSSDYVFTPIFNIFKQLEEQSEIFDAYVFDLDSSLILNNHCDLKIFFSEAYNLSKLLQDSNEGIKLKNSFHNLIINNNLKMLYSDERTSSIIDEVFFPLAITLIAKRIFKILQYSSIMVINDGTKIGNAVILAANMANVKSYSIRTLYLPPDPLIALSCKADKILLYGKHGMEILTSQNVSSEKLLVTGNPRYDDLLNYEFDKADVQNSNQKKLVVVGLTRWHNEDDIWMSKLIKFCNEKNFDIVIKVHPIYRDSMQEINEKMISSIKKSCKNMKFLVSYDLELNDLLNRASIVISDHSNLGVQTILLKKPLIAINFWNEDISNLSQFFTYDYTILTEKYTELETILTEILLEGKHYDIFNKVHNEFFNKWNYLNDGKASVRIVDFLLKNN